MVLTSFECWAHGGGINGSVVNTDSGLEPTDIETIRRNNRGGVDLFNPRSVSQISSNGYYGFSHINPIANIVPDNTEQDQHEDNNNNNNHRNNYNNNNQQTVNCANASSAGGAARCKKRFYDSDMEIENFFSNASNTGTVAAKRCRYDDADMAAQYCNDFFSLPVTQIGTQSCLMDIEEQQQNVQFQQIQVDETLTIGHNQNTQQQISAAIQQVQAQPLDQQRQRQQQQQQQQQQHHHHHHNQHYQDQTPKVRKKLATKEISVRWRHTQKNTTPVCPDDTEAADTANDMFMSMHGGSLQQFMLQSLNERSNDHFYNDI